jgi:hypothetical protein
MFSLICGIHTKKKKNDKSVKGQAPFEGENQWGENRVKRTGEGGVNMIKVLHMHIQI